MKDEIKEMSKIELFLLDLKCSTEPTLTEKGKDLLLDYITNLQEENERYKKMFEAKERFSKIMPEDMNFIILSKADYDRQQEDIELVAIEQKLRIDKAIEYIKEQSKFIEGCDVYKICNKDILLNILQGKSDE